MPQRDWLEPIFLEEVVQVLSEHFEHEAGVSAVSETFIRPNHVERAGILLAKPQQDGHLDLALASIRRMVLQYLDRHHVVATMPPALHHLTERPLAQKLQHLHPTSGYVLCVVSFLNSSHPCLQSGTVLIGEYNLRRFCVPVALPTPGFVTGIHKYSVRRWNLWFPSAGVFAELLTSANTPAEGNQRCYLRTESLWIPVTKPVRTPPITPTWAFKP